MTEARSDRITPDQFLKLRIRVATAPWFLLLTKKPAAVAQIGTSNAAKLAQTLGTIVNAAKVLKEKGAKEIHVYITHGVLSGEAVDRIKKSRIKKLVITDTIDNSDKIRNAKNIEVLTISNLLAEAIKRISNSTSVSDLFK